MTLESMHKLDLEVEILKNYRKILQKLENVKIYQQKKKITIINFSYVRFTSCNNHGWIC